MPRKPKPKIGCYVRVSTKDKQTTASQRSSIRDWARANHIPTSELKWYEDKKSGKNTDRPALQKLLKAIDRGRVDTVVVYDLSRLARDLISGLKTLADLAQRVRVVSVSEQIDFNSSSGMLIARILLSVAQFQRETTVEKIKLGIQARRQAGKPIGRPRNQKKLNEIKRLHDKGIGVTEIAHKMKCSRANIYKALDRLAA